MTAAERLDYINNKQDYIAFYMSLPVVRSEEMYTFWEKLCKLVRSV